MPLRRQWPRCCVHATFLGVSRTEHQRDPSQRPVSDFGAVEQSDRTFGVSRNRCWSWMLPSQPQRHLLLRRGRPCLLRNEVMLASAAWFLIPILLVLTAKIQLERLTFSMTAKAPPTVTTLTLPLRRLIRLLWGPRERKRHFLWSSTGFYPRNSFVMSSHGSPTEERGRLSIKPSLKRKLFLFFSGMTNTLLFLAKWMLGAFVESLKEATLIRTFTRYAFCMIILVIQSQAVCSYHPIFWSLKLFLRGMPHLTERMKRVTRDEAARAKSERPPDFDAINRAKPLPKDPSPPAIPSKNIDEFISKLSDEEARFLARRRKEMLDRAAQVASANRDSPNLPTSAKDIGAYLSTLSDEEVLVLARRREQELRVLQSKLGQLVQRRQAPLPPRYVPAVRASQHVAGNIETINGLTHEEKLLLACHRSQRLTSGGLKNVDMLAQERARWEKMKNDLHASSMTAALLEQTHQAAQRSLPSNVLMQSNNSLSPHRRQCETASFPPDLHRQGTTQWSEMEAVIRLDNFRRTSNSSVPSELEAAILERAHQAKIQADGFAVDGAYHRVSLPSERQPERLSIIYLPRKSSTWFSFCCQGGFGCVTPSGHVCRVAKRIDSASASDWWRLRRLLRDCRLHLEHATVSKKIFF